MRHRLALLLSGVALIVAGCGGSDSSGASDSLAEAPVPDSTTTLAPTTTLPATTTLPLPIAADVPEGYKLFDGSEYGFTVALPDRWVPLDDVANITGPELAEIGANEDMIGFMQEVEAFGVFDEDLYAADIFGEGNISVVSFPLDPMTTPDIYEAMYPTVMEEMGAVLVSIDRMEIAGYESVFVVSELQFREGVSESHQYTVFTDNTGYTITISLPDPDDTDRQIPASIMDTFTVTPG